MMESFEERLARVRRLTFGDQEMISEFFGPRVAEFASANVSPELFCNRISSYLDEKITNSTLWGAFDERGCLLSTMGYYHWKSFPFATLGYMVTRNDLKTADGLTNGMILCLHKCLEQGENEGVKAFYVLQERRSHQCEEGSWRQYGTALTSRYYSSIETIVPANTSSDHHDVWAMMDKQTWPYDLVLWVMRLRPEYEEVINWGDGSPVRHDHEVHE